MKKTGGNGGEREKEDKNMMREWERDKDREMGEG